jgi:hypothetical protein
MNFLSNESILSSSSSLKMDEQLFVFFALSLTGHPEDSLISQKILACKNK